MTTTDESTPQPEAPAASAGGGVLIVDLSKVWGGAQASLCDWFAASPPDFQSRARALVACDALKERLSASGCRVDLVRVGNWRRSIPGLFVFGRDWRRLRGVITESAGAMDAIYLNGVRSGLPLIGFRRGQTPRVVLHLRDVRGSRLADRWVANRADAIIATTKFQAGMLTPRIGSAVERMTIVGNGVEAPTLGNRESVRKRLDIPLDAKVVVLAADFVSWKRHERLLGALALLGGWYGVLCGSARDGRGQRLRRDLENLSRTLRVDQRVRFPGALKIGDALAAADVLLSVADDEPFGRTVVEAMQVGLPVVAMNRGGPAELADGYDGFVMGESEIPIISAAVRAAAGLQPEAKNSWEPSICAQKILTLLKPE